MRQYTADFSPADGLDCHVGLFGWVGLSNVDICFGAQAVQQFCQVRSKGGWRGTCYTYGNWFFKTSKDREIATTFEPERQLDKIKSKIAV